MLSDSATRSDNRFTNGQIQFGWCLFLSGLAVLVLAAWDNSASLPFAMPRFWNEQRSLCLLIAVGALAFGGYVISARRRTSGERNRDARWRPQRPGRRFHAVVVYSRRNCALCDEAMEMLQSYAAFLPSIQVVDIDTDAALQARFDASVPVVECDGRIRFKGHVSEVLLRRLIDGTAPLEGSHP
jgi:hypothetical protein